MTYDDTRAETSASKPPLSTRERVLCMYNDARLDLDSWSRRRRRRRRRSFTKSTREIEPVTIAHGDCRASTKRPQSLIDRRTMGLISSFLLVFPFLPSSFATRTGALPFSSRLLAPFVNPPSNSLFLRITSFLPLAPVGLSTKVERSPGSGIDDDTFTEWYRPRVVTRKSRRYDANENS